MIRSLLLSLLLLPACELPPDAEAGHAGAPAREATVAEAAVSAPEVPTTRWPPPSKISKFEIRFVPASVIVEVAPTARRSCGLGRVGTTISSATEMTLWIAIVIAGGVSMTSNPAPTHSGLNREKYNRPLVAWSEYTYPAGLR